MKYVTKSMVITALVATILGVITVPVVAAPTPTIEIGSTPVYPQKPIYYHNPPDTPGDPYVLIGNYDVYNTATGVQFRWTMTPEANSYRVWMIQYDAPGKGPDGPSHVIKVGHHLGSDPIPNEYMMIGWGLNESFCLDCVTVLAVNPEIATLVQDANGAYDYQYTELPGLITSQPFVLENWGGGKSGNRRDIVCGDCTCNHKEAPSGGLYYCPFDCGPTRSPSC